MEQLSRGRHHESIDLLEVTDPTLKREVMAAFPVEVPHGVQFFVKLGLVKRAEPEQFAAAADKVAVFEIPARLPQND